MEVQENGQDALDGVVDVVAVRHQNLHECQHDDQPKVRKIEQELNGCKLAVVARGATPLTATT
jgi:hypothetical protein